MDTRHHIARAIQSPESRGDRFERHFMEVLLFVSAAVVGLVLIFAFSAQAQTVLGNPEPAPAKATLLELVLQYVVAPMIPVIGGMVVWALKRLADYLHSKSEGSKLAAASAAATDYLEAAFEHVRAGMTPDLQAALADGKIDAAEMAALKKKFVELVKLELPVGIKTVLMGVFGAGFETWLSGKAEKLIAAAAEPSPS